MCQVQNAVAGLAEDGMSSEDIGKKQREKHDPVMSILQMYSTGPIGFGGLQTSWSPLGIKWKKRG